METYQTNSIYPKQSQQFDSHMLYLREEKYAHMHIGREMSNYRSQIYQNTEAF